MNIIAFVKVELQLPLDLICQLKEKGEKNKEKAITGNKVQTSSP